MKISDDTVAYISSLSKLDVTGEESREIIDELNAFVGYMDILNELDTENVEPISHIIPLKNVMRKDIVENSYKREDILKNAPVKNEEYFVVPKTVE